MASLCMALFIAFVSLFNGQNVSGFSVELYQRDSYGSPFYDPTISKTEIIRRAIARSVNKSNMVTLNSPVADLTSSYLMKIRLGTPPIDILAIADTGSDLTWTQCQPCTKCMPQRMPLFDSQESSTYARVSCGPSHPCPPWSKSQCNADGFCHYDTRYYDETYTKGFLSTETMRMGSTKPHYPIVEIPKFKFGCGTDNDGYFGGDKGSSGVIGLGAGPLSLVSQLGPLSMQRFSYCLIPLIIEHQVSHIYFGQDAFVHGPGTVRLPLVNKQPISLYFVTLEALTVGVTRIELIDRSGIIEEGNIMIDSGTSIVELPRHIYAEIRHAVTMQTHALPVPDPARQLDLCFEKETVQLPSIIAHFRGGDVNLNRYNAFMDVEHVNCLAFGVSKRFNIYGSFAQPNFRVGFDKIARTVSFKPFDCTNA